MRSTAVERILALAYVPLLTAGIAACGSDPAGAAGPQDRTEAGPIPHTTSSQDLRVRPLTAVCGNGVLDAGEQCDDGNVAAHDGCSATCTIELVTQFSFTGAAGNEVTFIASVADPALATTPMMSRGIGVTASTASDAFSASAWTTSTTLDPNDFYSFTVAPATGRAMNLSALQLDERRSTTGIRRWSVRSSLDGFASDIAVFSVPDDANTRTETAQLPAQLHDVTTAVEFRIFGYQSEAAGGTWRIDNVALIGGVASTCGNGFVDAGEQCDDGNGASHDGCSASCAIELVTQFTFTGAAGSEATFAASLADPGLAATPAMSRGAGVAPSTATDAFSASAWTTGTTLDPGDYFSFTVTPAAGNALNLRAVLLDERRSATGIRSWSLRSSLDGFASDIAVFTVPDDTLTRSETAQLPAQFHDVTTAVEFRIFGYQSEAAGGTWRIDNVALIGGIAPACGNGIVDPGEQCDDANTVNLDGCNNSCQITAPLYVKASTVDSQDGFGFSVAVSADGSTMAVGAMHESSAATGINGDQSNNSVIAAGAVFVFTRSGATWTQQAYIKASSTDEFDEFGYSVALSADGSTLAVGMPFEASAATGIDGDQTDNSAPSAGAVCVFKRTGTTWSQQAYVKASNTGASDRFGSTIALSGDGATLAVSALETSAATGINGNQADNSAPNAGAAYLFARSGTTWSQQAYVKASNTGAQDNFGSALALSGDGSTLAVGALNEASAATGINGNQADNSTAGAGAVYLFARSGTTWSQQAYVKASNPGTNDFFGLSVALTSDASVLAVSAVNEASAATGIGGNQADNSTGGAGAVYLFR